MESVTVFSPAKINLMLAVTGRRPDGYHELISVVAPLQFGDTLKLRRLDDRDEVRLHCAQPEVPAGGENLAVRAAEAFFSAVGKRGGLEIELTKRIPIGAGLGGGSSNAAAVLRGLNLLWNEPLDPAALSALAAQLGSDCPLFLIGGSCVMRGRGERVALLPVAARQRLGGTRVLVFKPHFGVATPWAYARLAATPGALSDPVAAEERLTAWLHGGEPTASLLHNSFTAVVGRKFLVLPVLLAALKRAPGVSGVLLSGSGSACFALLDGTADADALLEQIRAALGASAFAIETALA